MGIFTYNIKQNNDRFALGCFGIFLLMMSPLLVGNIATMLVKQAGQSCTASSGCFWAEVSTYVEYTVPLGGVILLLYIPLWLFSNYDVVDSTEAYSDGEESVQDEAD